MASQLLIAVGFLAATAAVIALARGSTARWERDSRARAAARADDERRRTSSAGTWMRGAAARRAVDAVRRHAVGHASSGLRGRLRRVPHVRRRALALLHRHGPPNDVPKEDSGDRPTAR